MSKFIIRRALGLIPTMLIIITVCFFLIRVAPGGPFSSEKKIPPQIMKNIEAKYHLDEPLVMQYGRYVVNVIRGDLGPSYKYKDYDVNYYIGEGLPKSLLLGTLSILLALILGMAAGMFSALRQNTWVDYTWMSFAVVGISVPTFVLGPILMFIFSINLKWLPVAGWLDEYGVAALVLPVVTLFYQYFATIARLSRASFLEAIRSDYVRTAKAKGLKTSYIMMKHVLKGASLPVVSYLGPAFSGIITGSIVVEQIFRVPGLGRHFVQSAFNRDYTMIMGTVIVYSLILVIMNFLVDVLYGYLDPRISYS
ncbi:MAG: oligopeptide ABC transporter permease OppB [Spirochaetales bacterium]|uniref:Oligopeptide ABC transporter permease OppB n=1 Tax=Candidatus Thalassospirochaeta sargassi TaxID=3119039 RepID=A0AAJ1IDT1_9SPIO|nr:oligopeptide ABC transporter permease OppB [Spirochaetales bacterium]